MSYIPAPLKAFEKYAEYHIQKLEENGEATFKDADSREGAKYNLIKYLSLVWNINEQEFSKNEEQEKQNKIITRKLRVEMEKVENIGLLNKFKKLPKQDSLF